MSRNSSIIEGGLGYIKQHPQLIMTILLVCVIPIAFIFSGEQFLNAARGNQERLEKEKVGILHDVFMSIMVTNNYDSKVIQSEITRIAQLNIDITKFTVVHEQGPYLEVFASLDATKIGSLVDEPDAYRIANADPKKSFIQPTTHDGIRYWDGYRLVHEAGKDAYYIYTETSLVNVDASFAKAIASSYYWLTGLLVIVMYLVLRHVRLIDYAFLYSETKKQIQSRDMFTNMIAHELRAPLTAMRGYASMILEKKNIAPEVHEYARRIEVASERLVLVVSDLLDVARINSGKLSVSPAKTDIQQIISSVIEAMHVSADEKNIVLTQEGILNPTFIIIDEKRFYQALTNLVSNSIKYTQAGTISISLEQLADRVELRIKDTGAGISAKNQKNLFSPFFRVQGETEGQTVGTGLGLWITKQLIELMKGTIEVESIKGVGTHIVVTLPKE